MRAEQDPLLAKINTITSVTTSVGYRIDDAPHPGWVQGCSYTAEGRDNFKNEFVKYVDLSPVYSYQDKSPVQRSSAVGSLTLQLAGQNPAIPLDEVFDKKGDLVKPDFVYLAHQAKGLTEDGDQIEIDLDWRRSSNAIYLEKLTTENGVQKAFYSSILFGKNRVYGALSDEYVKATIEHVREGSIIPWNVLRSLNKTLEEVSATNNMSRLRKFGHGIAHVAGVATKKTGETVSKGGHKLMDSALHIVEERHKRSKEQERD